MTNPKHIAFILDGNGRWAKKRGLPRTLGHREGVKAIERTLLALIDLKIPYASFYAFSTDNWKRSQEEIFGLFDLAKQYFSKGIDFFNSHDIKVTFFGDLSAFPMDLQIVLKEVSNKTKNNKTLVTGFCLNYREREDIVHAINSLLKANKKLITLDDISKNLYSKNFPDPDFVIRTSGEQRLSNFQLWQISYSELYFPKVLWPDFNKKYLLKSLKVFSKRKRRFGGY